MIPEQDCILRMRMVDSSATAAGPEDQVCEPQFVKIANKNSIQECYVGPLDGLRNLSPCLRHKEFHIEAPGVLR
jgi:hypothetical protein